MEEDKPWRVTNVQRVLRLDDAGNPRPMIAIAYFVSKYQYGHSIELPEAEATPDAIRASIQADYDRLAAIYGL